MKTGFKVQESLQRRNNVQNKSFKNILAAEKETETFSCLAGELENWVTVNLRR